MLKQIRVGDLKIKVDRLAKVKVDRLAKVKELKEHIRKYGIVEYVVINKDTLEVIDGVLRVMSLIELGQVDNIIICDVLDKKDCILYLKYSSTLTTI